MAMAALILLLTACGAADISQYADFSEQDSAGVRIVENGAPVWRNGTGWEISSDPQLEIGMVDGPEEQLLHGVVGVRRNERGEILIVQRSDIRLYDRSGNLLHRYGGKGAGPGEFDQIATAAACSDQIVASDLLRPRVTLFDSGGGVRTLPLEPPEPGRLRPLQIMRCIPGAVVGELAAAAAGSASADDINRGRVLAVNLSLEDGGLRTILEYPGRETFRGLQVPFGRTTLLAYSSSAVYLADTGTAEVRVFDLQGDLREIIRLRLPEVRIAGVDLERIRGQYLDGVPAPVRAEIEPLLNTVPIPATMPYFSALRIGSDGTIWIRAYQPFRDEPVRSWIVISAEGRWLGEVAMPDGFEPHEFDGGEILGVWKDEYGVEQVRGYAFQR
jgi:hypothetical protein